MPEERQPFLISLSSFGAVEVRRHGQAWFAKLAAEAGADGVEIRGELLVDATSELPAIAQAVPALQRVFSSPQPLVDPVAGLDLAAVESGIEACRQLQAPRLKMSIGEATAASPAGFRALQKLLADSAIDLVIENDQTASAGTLAPLQRFFEQTASLGLELGMTFDIGNWHWAGECPLKMAEVFRSRVRYVHCKGVQRQPQRWVAVPLADSAAPWRAVVRKLPAGQPWAIEYPLVGDDLLDVTRRELAVLRAAAERK